MKNKKLKDILLYIYMKYISNYNSLFKLIIGFRTGFSAILLQVFRKKISKFTLTNTWNLYMEIKIKYIFLLLFFLKKHCLLLFSFLIDLICYEIKNTTYRYMLIYNLLSININLRLTIKTKILFNTKSKILSILTLFLNGSWAEREIFDFYGLYFFFNNDLRRLLLDYGFKGYPLHKNFPLSGYIELYYDEVIRKIVYEKVDLNLEYRMFLNKL